MHSHRKAARLAAGCRGGSVLRRRADGGAFPWHGGCRVRVRVALGALVGEAALGAQQQERRAAERVAHHGRPCFMQIHMVLARQGHKRHRASLSGAAKLSRYPALMATQLSSLSKCSFIESSTTTSPGTGLPPSTIANSITLELSKPYKALRRCREAAQELPRTSAE